MDANAEFIDVELVAIALQTLLEETGANFGSAKNGC